MLSELRFVQGAIAKKEIVTALTHFIIEKGTIRSFNGTLALCSPIELDIECKPKAETLVKAIRNCKETVTMTMTESGRLGIKSGPFRAFIECLEGETPHVVPEGKEFSINGEELLNAIKAVSPFIGDDASRPWSNGILLKGQSAFATNNISLVEYWVGDTFPIICNIPRAAVKEMLRINEIPQRAQVTERSISFHYEGGRWLRTALLHTAWPDLQQILEAKCNPMPIDELIFEGLDVIKPFIDKLDRVYISNGAMSTTIIPSEGASFDIPDFAYEGVYQLRILNLLRTVATSADFSLYPKPCLFFGKRLRGALIGMRK